MFVAYLLLFGVELLLLAANPKVTWEPTFLGYLLLSLAIPIIVVGVGLGVGVALVRRAGARGRGTQRSEGGGRRAIAILMLSTPLGLWFGVVLTEGAGIRRSGYRWPVAFFTAILLVLPVVSIGVGWARIVGSRILRVSTVSLLFLGAATSLAVASIQPYVYIRPHRGVILVAALALTTGLMLGRSRSATSRTIRATGETNTLCLFFGPPRAFVVWALLLFCPIVLLELDPSRRGQALYQLFNYTLIGQKFQRPLAALFPDRPAVAGAKRAARKDLRAGALPPPYSWGSARRNLFLVSGDTLRRDVLQDGRVAPNIGRLVERDPVVVFEDAVTNYSFTDGAVPTLLSGDWNKRDYLAEDPMTRFPRLFGRAGFITIAVVPSRPHFRHVRGFDHVVKFDGNCMAGVDRVAEALSSSDGRPVFLWFHSIDAHAPHQTTSEDLLFGHDGRGTYLAAVHLFDRCVGRLLASQDEEARARTGWVFFSDHGEALGEHGRLLLHQSCYLHDLAIPLIFNFPWRGDIGPRRVRFRAQTIDFLPTLLALYGIDGGKEPFVGRDLSGFFSSDFHPVSDAGQRGWALSEGTSCASLLDDEWHLLFERNGGHYELFDVDKDPEETRNLTSERRDVVDALAPLLREHAERFRR